MNNMNIYAETNQLLWKYRLDCHTEQNQVGHDFICRVQRRLNTAIGELVQE